MRINLLSTLLVYVLTIRNDGDFFKVQKVLFIENNFWCADQEQFKTDKGCLSAVKFEVEHTSNYDIDFDLSEKTCYYLKSTNLGYVVLKNWLYEQPVFNFLNSPASGKFLFKFHYYFIDSLCSSEKYNFKIQEYVTYRLSEKMSKNSIKLKYDVSFDFHIKHIKWIEGFVKMKILRFFEYIETISENKKKEKSSETEDDAIFDLCFFKDYSKCLENLYSFVENLNYFKLHEDLFFNSSTTEFFEASIDKTTTLKVSQFKERLYEKFYESFRKLHGNEIDENLKPLFNRCCDYLKDELINNNIFLPIGGKYNIDHYIDQLSNLINELIKQKRIEYATSNPKKKILIFYKITDLLNINLEKLQLSAVKDFFESVYFHKHFFGNEIKTIDDYINLERMVCDYYNMLVCIFNLYHGFIQENNVNYFSYSYFPPIFIDNYNLRIITGIKIEFRFLGKYAQVKGFNTQGEGIILVKDTDYFIEENILYCPSEVLEMKKIHEIEIISSDPKENSKRFKINEYLDAFEYKP